MNISFSDTRVTKLSLELNENTGDNTFRFSFTPAFSDLGTKEFLIIFNLELTGDDFSLTVEFAARFSTDEEIDDNFKESGFVKINAPAIAFPYLRAYISNFTISSGLSPIVLPTINFTKFGQ
jgi:preprotein translocase subunit SecB